MRLESDFGGGILISTARKVLTAAAVVMTAGTLATAATPSPQLYSAMRWRLLGPFRGGWATVVTGVPQQPNTFYFGGAGGGVWKTENAGRTWKSVFNHVPAASIGALAVAASDPKIVYAGTGQVTLRYDVGAGYGLFKSTDAGKHWQSVGLTNTRHIGAIWIDPHDPNNVVVGVQGPFFEPSAARGVFRSTDGGAHWTRVLKINDWTGVSSIASDPEAPNVLYAAAWQARQYPWLSYFTPTSGKGSAIYKSVDGGVHWTRLSGGGWPQGDLGRISLAVTHTQTGARIYAMVSSKQEGGLWRSDDGGTHWQRVYASRAVSNQYASRITVSPRNPDVVYTVGQSIRRCDDGGSHCTIIKGAPGGDDYHDIWINPLHPDHIITGSDQGAVVSVDHWHSWSSWYNQPTAQFYHLAADNRFPYWIYAGQQDSGTVAIPSRSDYGQISYRDWHSVGGDERDYDIPDQTDPNIVFASGLGGRVTKWNAATGQVEDVTPWPEQDYGKRPTTTRYRYLWMTPLVGSRVGTPSLYLGAQVLFRTSDRGAHWQVISPDLTGKVSGAVHCNGNVTLKEAKDCGYGVISAIEPSPRHAREIWVGTDDGLIQVTRDGGVHWTNVTPPQIPLWGKVREISVSALTDGVAYAAIDTHRLGRFQPLVLRTRDYGRHWTEIDHGLPSGHFTSVVRADPVRAGLLYAGTDTGAYVSFDNGDDWQPLQLNLPTAWITDLLVHDGDLIAATEGRGIWILDDLSPLRQISAHMSWRQAHLYKPALAYRVHDNNNKDTPLPPETPTGQNPPSGAIIDYWLPAHTQGSVTLEIRDAKGTLVRSFSSAILQKDPPANRYFAKGWIKPPQQLSAAAGAHRFVWNLRYARPEAVSYGYSIAAVWGKDTPIDPRGAFVLPGSYTVTLSADGVHQTVPLEVKEDPRVGVTEAALQAELALSMKISAASREATTDYTQEAYLLHRLDTLRHKGQEPELGALRAALKPEGTPSFANADSKLIRIEVALESADAAPTAVQQQFVEDGISELKVAERNFAEAIKGPLARLNVARQRQGLAPIILPPASQLPSATAKDAGEDLP
ncbi:MAG: exo-alpha-sialidase [Alphaproteobacteria bacterium]|nr:exo-alpha-sialidase [Alphaproteobacteria bacterium]